MNAKEVKNTKYITKSINRECADLIPTLQENYSREFSVNVSQADAIGLAIKNEVSRFKK